MGWFDGLSGGGSSPSRGSDPLANLDPKVREFLQKESPLKLQTAEQAKQQAAAAATAQAAQAQAQTQEQQPPVQGAEATPLPSESLYPDGRYAALWKTYRPLTQIEAETKSDHERLMDVLDAFKDRRELIGRAALENCALEQVDWNMCIKTGPLRKRVTMCQDEMRKFERCYNMQSRLLKALGYLATYDRPPEVDERIQMHADRLYHRMLEQEEIVTLAKAEGRPVPAVDMSGITPLALPGHTAGAVADSAETAAVAAASAATTATAATTTDTEALPPDVRKQWDEKLSKLPPAERAAEEAALHAERRARTDLADRVAALRAAQAAEREQRKAEGKATLRDRVSGLLSGR